MATFKAVVQQHQQRRDGKFPISIRVTVNRKSCYISTGLYCGLSQINKKSFEIKDQFIIERTNKIIADWERRLLTIDRANILSMSTENLKKILTTSPEGIDFFAEARAIIATNPLKYLNLESALRVVEMMGIKSMSAMDFTSHFLRKFKEFMDTRRLPVTRNNIIVGYKSYSQNTKRQYLFSLCTVFRKLQQKYNTEFNTVIPHNPFFGLETYHMSVTPKRSISAEKVRAFFNLNVKSPVQQTAIDMMKLSFCLCGINLIDIFYLEKDAFDEKEMRISYIRHKTKNKRIGQIPTSVRVEPEIYDIIEKYRAQEGSKYLFAVRDFGPSYATSRALCSSVKYICKTHGFDVITPYWFRHTWATIARNECEVSKDDIDLCLAHAGNNPMADVYIRPDWSRIDRANRKVLDCVFGSEEK